MSGAYKTDTTCAECNSRAMSVTWTAGDLAYLRRRVIRRPSDELFARLEAAVAADRDSRALLDEHLAEAHPDGVEHSSSPFRVPAFIGKKAKPVPEGHARCDVCRRVVRLAGGGTRLRRHRTPEREPCPNIATDSTFKLAETPPVKMPPPAVSPQRQHERRAAHEPSRLDAGSDCRNCGKWLPGERLLCGRCFALGAAS